MFLDSVGRWRWHEQGPPGVELMNHSLQSVSMGVRCYVMLVVIKLKISEVFWVNVLSMISCNYSMKKTLKLALETKTYNTVLTNATIKNF